MSLHDASTKADYEYIEKKDGLFAGQLDPEEMRSFDRLCQDGLATRSYEGAAGFMGLARIRVRRDFSYDEVA